MNIRSWILSNKRLILEIISMFFVVYIAGYQTQEVNKIDQKLQKISEDGITKHIPEEERDLIKCIKNNKSNNSKEYEEEIIIYTEIPKLIRERAEKVARNIGLCISNAKKDTEEEETYEFTLSDRFSGSKLLEVDIVKNEENEVTIKEFERVVSLDFLSRNNELLIVEEQIRKYCEKPEDAFIEVSNRKDKEIPGLKIEGEGIFYEFECKTKTDSIHNGSYLEFEINDTNHKKVTTNNKKDDEDN